MEEPTSRGNQQPVILSILGCAMIILSDSMKIFDPNDVETWPLNMRLSEVAQVLRFEDAQVIRDMTEMPEADGGLPYLMVGTGKRRTRLVRRDDLVAFMARTTVGGLHGAVPFKRRTRKAAPTPMLTFLNM